MDNSNRKSPLKKFKSRLMAKLFCQSNTQNASNDPVVPSGSATVAASNCTASSSLDNGFRTEESALYATQCYPLGVKYNTSELHQNIGSSSYLSDDERSGSDLTVRKKRRKRCKSTETRKQMQQVSSSSSSSCAQALRNITPVNQPSSIESENMTKTQKKRFRKKQRDGERKPENPAYTGFSSDSA